MVDSLGYDKNYWKHFKTAFWAYILQQIRLDYFEISIPVIIST